MSREQSQEYRGNGEHNWENVKVKISPGDEVLGPMVDTIQRLRVPGGWLYRSLTISKEFGIQAYMQFVPMPEVVVHKV